MAMLPQYFHAVLINSSVIYSIGPQQRRLSDRRCLFVDSAQFWDEMLQLRVHPRSPEHLLAFHFDADLQGDSHPQDKGDEFPAGE